MSFFPFYVWLNKWYSRGMGISISTLLKVIRRLPGCQSRQKLDNYVCYEVCRRSLPFFCAKVKGVVLKKMSAPIWEPLTISSGSATVWRGAFRCWPPGKNSLAATGRHSSFPTSLFYWLCFNFQLNAEYANFGSYYKATYCSLLNFVWVKSG